jgi:hypothetical protein
MQGQTVVHSNQLSSLVHSNANNTSLYNTALGSQRGNTRGEEKRPTKKTVSNQNVMVSKMVKTQGSKRFEGNAVYSMDSQKPQQQMKQTAQFGPQMNLIKSHLPHSGQNKIKSAEMRQK